MAKLITSVRKGKDDAVKGVMEGYSGINDHNTALEVDVFSKNWQSPLDTRNPADPGPDPLGLEGATEPMSMGVPENPMQINGPEFESPRTGRKNHNDSGYGYGPAKVSHVAKRGKG